MDWSSSPELDKLFDTQERDRRWSRVRELMGQQGVDLLLVFPQWLPEDALWLANETGVVVFPAEGEPALIKGGEGSDRAAGRAEGWIADRGSATARGSTRVPYGEAAARRLAGMGLDGRRVAIAGLRGHDLILVRQPEGYVNHTSVMAVMASLPRTEIVDGTPIMAAARHRKSEAELQVMREAVKIAEASARALAEHARAGAPQAEVFAQMLLAQMRAGATEVMTSWCGGRWGEHKWRYVTPPPGAIEPSWYVSTEIGPALRGYNCQISEPVVVGTPDPEAVDIFELGKAAFTRLCELMRAGSTWGEVEDGVAALARGTGFNIEFLIHGRGLGSEGPMLIPVDTHEHVKDRPLEPNSAFILKPYAYPADREYVPVTRQYDATWGDTVVVREHGAERLGTRPHELLQVG